MAFRAAAFGGAAAGALSLGEEAAESPGESAAVAGLVALES